LIRHLVLPDSHSKPGVDNKRYTWVGRAAVDYEVDKIINLGDLFDLPSLCAYDKGKKGFEGRRLSNDIAAGIDAMEKLLAPIGSKVDLHYIIGNHEKRISRVAELDSELDGTIGLHQLRLDEFGWKVHPFKTIAFIDNIAYTHYFTSGLMDNPIGGVNLGRSILNKMHTNAFQGHCHTWDLANTSLANGKKIWGGSLGCLFDHKEDYVSARAQAEWTRGITILDIENDEIQDISFVSLNTLRRNYGRK
jgi:hypothetical protein